MDPASYLRKTLEESIAIKQKFVEDSGASLIAASQAMAKVIESGGKILFCGNGGSAADSQHAAAEMVGRMLMERRALPALALSTDTSNLTAIGNDYGYEFIFERQVRAIARPGDLLVAISTSGKSRNILLAAQAAKDMGCKVLGISGGDGGVLSKYSDYFLCASLGKNSSRIQETHIFILHSLVDLLDQFFLTHEKK